MQISFRSARTLMLESQDLILRLEVINAYIDFDKFNPEICEQKLLEIATNGDSLARSVITSRLWFQSLQDKKKEIGILRICAGDKDTRVQENILRILAAKGQTFLDEGLEILKIMIKMSSFYYVPDLDYYVKELCKDKKEYCIETFNRWISNEPEKLDMVFCYRVSNLQKELK